MKKILIKHLGISKNTKIILIIATSIAGLLLTTVIVHAAARITFGTGYYTNLYGSGTTADNYTGSADCDPEQGYCEPEGDQYLFAFICDGEVTECTNGNTESLPLQSKTYVDDGYVPVLSQNTVIKAQCDQTIQVDVFTHNCRADGGWSCGADDLKGYMVWYNSCDEETENTPPQCVLTADPTRGLSPLTVNFDASNSFDDDGNISEYIWNIAADIVSTTTPTLKRTFNQDGNFNITLSVKDNDGELSSNDCAVNVLTTTPDPITPPDDEEDNEAPVCKIASVTPTSGNEPLRVRFDASDSTDSDGTVITYNWNFGDGTTGTGVSPNHTYNGKDVTYTATLTVADNDGVFSSNSCTAQISLGSGDEEDEDTEDEEISFDIEKEVRKYNSDKGFEERITFNDLKVQDTVKVEFKIKVKNTGNVSVDNMKYEDDLPDHFTRIGGSGLTEYWDDFEPGETKEFTIYAELDSAEVTLDKSECYVNRVELEHDGDNEGKDDAIVCINTGEITELPETGATATVVLAVIGLSSLVGGLGLKGYNSIYAK